MLLVDGLMAGGTFFRTGKVRLARSIPGRAFRSPAILKHQPAENGDYDQPNRQMIFSEPDHVSKKKSTPGVLFYQMILNRYCLLVYNAFTASAVNAVA